jgi:hypothetical protein
MLNEVSVLCSSILTPSTDGLAGCVTLYCHSEVISDHVVLQTLAQVAALSLGLFHTTDKHRNYKILAHQGREGTHKETTRRNERAGTEWKIGMKMKVWKNKELLTDEEEKETVKSNPWTSPGGSRRLKLPYFKTIGT